MGTSNPEPAVPSVGAMQPQEEFAPEQQEEKLLKGQSAGSECPELLAVCFLNVLAM